MLWRTVSGTALAVMVLLGTTATAHTQNEPIDHQLACDTVRAQPDQTRIEVCTFPSGTQTIRLNEPSIREHPLLYLRTYNGTLLWAPVAERYLPQSWAALPGGLLYVQRPTTPPCMVLASEQTVYFTYSDGAEVYAALDGSAYCVLPLSR
jgi:hypothetical protein